MVEISVYLSFKKREKVVRLVGRENKKRRVQPEALDSVCATASSPEHLVVVEFSVRGGGGGSMHDVHVITRKKGKRVWSIHTTD